VLWQGDYCVLEGISHGKKTGLIIGRGDLKTEWGGGKKKKKKKKMVVVIFLQ